MHVLLSGDAAQGTNYPRFCQDFVNGGEAGTYLDLQPKMQEALSKAA
jgi:hypothetical protein